MRYIIFLLLIMTGSCTKQNTTITTIVLDNNTINTTFLHQIELPEKTLLSWYLYAYGNECSTTSSKIKCQLLKEMDIDDECESQHLSNLLQWFSKDMLAVYKLNKCPNLPVNSAIQNTFKHITLIRKADTLSIKFSVMGLNTLQEKSWNITQIDSYVIKNNTFLKIESNE